MTSRNRRAQGLRSSPPRTNSLLPFVTADLASALRMARAALLLLPPALSISDSLIWFKSASKSAPPLPLRCPKSKSQTITPPFVPYFNGLSSNDQLLQTHLLRLTLASLSRARRQRTTAGGGG